MGEPDIPAATPWAFSRKPSGPVISKITRSKPGRIASGSVPMTRMSKLVGRVPRTTVRPVPLIPDVIDPSGNTAGGLGQVGEAGAATAFRLAATMASETVAPRKTPGRTAADRALPKET